MQSKQKQKQNKGIWNILKHFCCGSSKSSSLHKTDQLSPKIKKKIQNMIDEIRNQEVSPEKEQIAQEEQENINIEQESEAKLQEDIEPQQDHHQPQELQQQEYPALKQDSIKQFNLENKQMRLCTKYSLKDIDVCEYKPKEKEFAKYYTYNCPICFRYFNKILKAKCCQNYLCHYCLKDMYLLAKKKEDQPIICCFCQSQHPYYIDVDLDDKVKRYTDSPIFSPRFDNKENISENIKPMDLDERSFKQSQFTGNSVRDSQQKPPFPKNQNKQQIILIKEKKSSHFNNGSENVENSANKSKKQIHSLEIPIYINASRNYLSNNALSNSGKIINQILQEEQQQQ